MTSHSIALIILGSGQHREHSARHYQTQLIHFAISIKGPFSDPIMTTFMT